MTSQEVQEDRSVHAREEKERWNGKRMRMTSQEVQEKNLKLATTKKTKRNQKRMAITSQEVQEDRSVHEGKGEKDGMKRE